MGQDARLWAYILNLRIGLCTLVIFDEKISHKYKLKIKKEKKKYKNCNTIIKCILVVAQIIGNQDLIGEPFW